MNATGIVAEYNPFHKGHAYLAAQARQNGADTIVAVMSGNVMQRGEFPLFPASVRAEAALQCGIDLVLELPAPYALQSAEGFAQAAISLLSKTGIVRSLCFGAETSDTTLLLRTAEVLQSEAFAIALKEKLAGGVSFPVARQHALYMIAPELEKTIETPNNILGVEYCKAILQNKYTIAIHPIQRIGNEHDAPEAQNGFASASALRTAVAAKDFSTFFRYTATSTRPIYENAFEYGNYFLPNEKFDTALLAVLRTKSVHYFQNIVGCSEGLEHLLYESAQKAVSAKQLYTLTKSKRYTHSRIRRFALSAVLGYTKDLPKAPPYLHILGATKKGLALLQQMKKVASLPFSHSLAELKKENSACSIVAKRAAQAGSIYSLLLQTPQASGADYTSPFLKM